MSHQNCIDFVPFSYKRDISVVCRTFLGFGIILSKLPTANVPLRALEPWVSKEEFHIHLRCFGTLSLTLSTVVLYRFICQMQQAWEHPDPDPDKDPVQIQIQIQIQIQSRVPQKTQIAA